MSEVYGFKQKCPVVKSGKVKDQIADIVILLHCATIDDLVLENGSCVLPEVIAECGNE